MVEKTATQETKEIIVDHYRVLDKIAAGGMGAVYRAYEPALDRHVALKFLSQELCRDSRIVERFDLEAKAAADLQHPNIVSVFFRGRVKGRPYFAMELIDGESLADIAKKGPLQPKLAVDLMLQAAKGLKAAWKKKRLHRDIKPANLMVTEDNLLKITDFGLAKALDSEGGLTSANIVVGTPHFISPEQAQGLPVDCRSDIYSLGASFYFLLSGTLPFVADTAMGILVKHINSPLPPLHNLRPTLPTALCSAIERMMAKKPEDRFQDYGELTEQLKALYEHIPADCEATPSNVSIPSASESQAATLNSMAKPVSAALSAAETQAGMPTPLSQPNVSPPTNEGQETLHSQPAPMQTSLFKKLSKVLPFFLVLFLIFAVAQKKKIKSQTLTELPPPAKAEDVERSLLQLRKRIPHPIPLVHLRALVEFVSSYANLPGAQERIPADSPLRHRLMKIRDSHLWPLGGFHSDQEKLCFELLESLSVDVRPNLRLFDKLLGVEQGIAYMFLRFPPREINYMVLRDVMTKEMSKRPPPEEWRRERAKVIYQRVIEKPANLKQFFMAYNHLAILSRLGKIDNRWLVKQCVRTRQKAEKDEHGPWNNVENALANIRFAANQVMYPLPKRNFQRTTLTAFMHKLKKKQVHNFTNLHSANVFTVEVLKRLWELTNSFGLPLKNHIPEELFDFPNLNDQEETQDYLARFPVLDVNKVNLFLAPVVPSLGTDSWQQQPHQDNDGGVRVKPLREVLRENRRARRQQRFGF